MNSPNCFHCRHYDADYARLLGHTGCRLGLGCWWDNEGSQHPKADRCYEEKDKGVKST